MTTAVQSSSLGWCSILYALCETVVWGGLLHHLWAPSCSLWWWTGWQMRSDKSLHGLTMFADDVVMWSWSTAACGWSCTPYQRHMENCCVDERDPRKRIELQGEGGGSLVYSGAAGNVRIKFLKAGLDLAEASIRCDVWWECQQRDYKVWAR